ncbi:hypothetical protein GTQ34_13655 [Muricauda sp. JGD-17]|uniref:Uncharacterized protein n=1 Tax=Flagellimonas ochracea TaxID=2696472 RepID=A0A964WYV1_9FLAO|nr:DUF6563 family protein [Allomuricauda ochracea]NAY92964.1 hypothetical protein [Allomuricauda ochracea]
MKNVFPLLVLILICNKLSAQTESYPKGGYASFQEVLERSPSADYNLEIEKRSEGKIWMSAGNDYQLNPLEKSVKKKYLRKELHAYADGTDLYLNGYKYEIQFWYSKVEAENDECFLFRAGLPSNFERYGIETSALPNMFGGIFAGLSAGKRALIRVPYILYKETEEVYLITDKDLMHYMGDDKDLWERYTNDSEKNDIDILMRYLSEWVNK